MNQFLFVCHVPYFITLRNDSLFALIRTIREMKDACFGSRPMKVKRGEWQEQDLRHFQKKKKKYNDLKMVQLD